MAKIEVDSVVNRAGTGAPSLDLGCTVPATASVTGAGGLNIAGALTVTTNMSGSGSGLTGISAANNSKVYAVKHVVGFTAYRA